MVTRIFKTQAVNHLVQRKEGFMNFARFLSIESIELNVDAARYEDEENQDIEDQESQDGQENQDQIDKKNEEYKEENENKEGYRAREAHRQECERLLKRIAKLLYASNKISSCSKLTTSLIFNHRKAPSAIGCGVAIPHVRCLQGKSLTMAFARSPQGIDFDAPDNNKVQIFIGMTAPPYDDKLYLKLYRSIAKAILETDVKEQLLNAKEPGEIIRIFNQYFI